MSNYINYNIVVIKHDYNGSGPRAILFKLAIYKETFFSIVIQRKQEIGVGFYKLLNLAWPLT